MLLKLKKIFQFRVVSWHHCMGVIPCSRLMCHRYEGVTLRSGEISFMYVKLLLMVSLEFLRRLILITSFQDVLLMFVCLSYFS